jgi:protein SCO1/2
MLGLLLAGVLLAPRPLPVLGQVPDFRALAQDGRVLRRSELAGKVWVADFIFTTCKDVCPAMTAVMRRAQKALAAQGAVRFVSFSVDPVQDTPARMLAFGLQHGADFRTWSFLTTGDVESMERVARGFKIFAGQVARPVSQADGAHAHHHAAPPPVTHGRYFVLVDQKGAIRGYYRPEDEGLAKLVADAGALVAR